MISSSPAQESIDLRVRLERALSGDGHAVARLGAAGTSVSFRVTDALGASVTLLLDRKPPQVAERDEPAEVTILLTAEQAGRFARGQLALPAALVAGQVSCRGPVRKYLVVDPILRARLAEADRETEA